MNILLVRMSCIGDILHVTPVAKALKKAWPNCRLYWIATPSLAPILKENPYVDEIIEWERDTFEAEAKKLHGPTLWNMWWELRKKLVPYEFDLAIDVQGLLISGLVLLASQAKRKIGMGHTKEGNGLFLQEKCLESYTHVVERYLNVLHLLGIESDDYQMDIFLTEEERVEAQTLLQVLDSDLGDALPVLDLKDMQTVRPLLGLVLGTSWPSKEWIPTYWIDLVHQLSGTYRLVYLGGPNERRIAEQLPTGEHILDLVGKTTLRQLAAIIDQVDCLVSGDTGALHMAIALQRPSISFFGPTDPNQWGAFTEGHVILQAVEVPCLGCRHRKCPKPGHPCMQLITPRQVVSEIEKVIRNGKI